MEDVDIENLRNQAQKFLETTTKQCVPHLHALREPSAPPPEETKDKNQRMYTHDPEPVQIPEGFHFALKPDDIHNYTQDKISRVFLQRGRTNRVLFFEATVREISSINLQHELFDVTVRFYLTWLALPKDLKSFMKHKADGEKGKWTPPSKPNIRVRNAKVGEVENRWFKLMVASDYTWLDSVVDNEVTGTQSSLGFDARFGIWVRARYEFKGTVVEEFELHSFPFDCQDMKILFRCEDHLVIAPLPTKEVYLKYNPQRSALADFNVVTIGGEFGKSSPDQSRGGKIYGDAAVVVKMKRNWKSRSHILLSVGMLGFVALVVFVLDPHPIRDDGMGGSIEGGLGNRVNYLVTLILADIALQQTVRNKLGDFEYMTALDKFIQASFMFKVVILIWVALPFFPIYTIDAFYDARQVNIVAAWIFAALYVIFLVLSSVYFVQIRYIEKNKNFKSTAELDINFGIEDHTRFEVTMTDGVMHFLNDTNAKTKEPGSYFQRLVQYGKRERESNALMLEDEFSLIDKKQEHLNRTLHLRLTFAFLFCIIGCLTAYFIDSTLKGRLRLQIIVIVGVSFLVTFVNVAIALYNDEEYIYDFPMMRMAAIIGGAVVSGLQAWFGGDTRVSAMSLALTTWSLARTFGNVRYLWREAGDRPKLILKYMSYVNDLHVEQKPGEEPDEVSVTKRAKFLWKHALVAIILFLRAFIHLLPIFVVQVAMKESNNIPGLFTKLDIAGIMTGSIALVIMVLAAWYGDAESVWNRDKKFKRTRLEIPKGRRRGDTFTVQRGDTFTRQGIEVNNNKFTSESNVLAGTARSVVNAASSLLPDVTEERFAETVLFEMNSLSHAEEQDEKGYQPSSSDSSSRNGGAVAGTHASVSQTANSTEHQSLQDDGLLAVDSNSPILGPTTPRSHAGSATEMDKPDKNCASCCEDVWNPYAYARFPGRLSELLVWIGLWLVSVVVWRFYLVAIVSVGCPVGAFIYQSVVSVPMLDNFTDDEFGECAEYRDYKDRTGALWPLTFLFYDKREANISAGKKNN